MYSVHEAGSYTWGGILRCCQRGGSRALVIWREPEAVSRGGVSPWAQYCCALNALRPREDLVRLPATLIKPPDHPFPFRQDSTHDNGTSQSCNQRIGQDRCGVKVVERHPFSCMEAPALGQAGMQVSTEEAKVFPAGLDDTGRLAFRIIFDTCPELEIVHVNEPSALESSAYLIKFDSVHGMCVSRQPDG